MAEIDRPAEASLEAVLSNDVLESAGLPTAVKELVSMPPTPCGIERPLRGIDTRAAASTGAPIAVPVDFGGNICL